MDSPRSYLAPAPAGKPRSVSGSASGKADLHLHTSASDGMAEPVQLLDYVEKQTDLDVIAVTDHDTLTGAWQVREQWAKRGYRFEVITGMEITAQEGHILALFVDAPVPAFRRIEETLEAVHKQGGICIIPHPMSWLTRSLGQRVIERIVDKGIGGDYFDGIETANQTVAARVSIRKAALLNEQRYHLATLGCSDAHFLPAVGSSYTIFPGSSANDLRQSILERQTLSANGHHPGLREIGAGQIARQTWRGLTTTPRTQGLGPTAASFVRRIFPFFS